MFSMRTEAFNKLSCAHIESKGPYELFPFSFSVASLSKIRFFSIPLIAFLSEYKCALGTVHTLKLRVSEMKAVYDHGELFL